MKKFSIIAVLALAIGASASGFTGGNAPASQGGFLGGHSGVEIDKGRVNADILAGRFLNHIKKFCDFDIINIFGGDKDNAIPNKCVIELCVTDVDLFIKTAEEYLNIIKAEISDRENGFTFSFDMGEKASFKVLSDEIKKKLTSTSR